MRVGGGRSGKEKIFPGMARARDPWDGGELFQGRNAEFFFRATGSIEHWHKTDCYATGFLFHSPSGVGLGSHWDR